MIDKTSKGGPRRKKRRTYKGKPLIYDLTVSQLQEWLVENGEPAYRAKQLFHWLYVKRVHHFNEMTNISKTLRTKLNDAFDMVGTTEAMRQVSKDGTIKFLLELRDGYSIETVIMRHDYGNSVCVTTQVGCQIGCTFCASTLGGLKRNLTSGEIVSQVLLAQRALDESGERASHVVVMGIGEPFENFDPMLGFLSIINDNDGLNIGARHITVSTSGIIPKIIEFADLQLQMNLAISLHAADSDIRTRLMPINKAYPLDKLLDAARYYVQKTRRRITFEYGLFGGVNDSEGHAHQLADAVQNMNCLVNLIPVNDVPERNYVRTPKKDIFAFYRVLEARGIPCTIRREHGSDIAAACGQLRAQERKEETV